MPPKRKASSIPARSASKKRKTAEKKEEKAVNSRKSTKKKVTKVPPGPSLVTTKTGSKSTDLKSLIKDEGWRSALEEEFKQEYMVKLEQKLDADYKTKEIFPPEDLIFNALNLTPINDIKVVIIGQDPYHDDGQAMGLCFSVPEGITVPPSLKNIYTELKTDKDIPGFKIPGHGDLTKWAKRGVLLLNATLTVQAHTPNSHKDYGWQKFTDKIIGIISDQCDRVVFILWGNFAQKKGKIIDDKKHCVIKNGHPSPLSVKHFLGCKCFSKTNEALKKFERSEIDWRL
ncbi:hypothetical protein LOTGIDRAFT_175470 [Lottia gigantea]|uniref:Uracil-DNA glycosylase n=1 Tax=Lottia gigantea TaxID=225164 RepID=V4AGW5_LOTGI|nr:hypothetical protein LOTGIDRAFT_175470 [Lottia gigantea]ESO94375.1 hypothetical protein LOTGIDRAFT_175470 [Lottia gigantea]